MQRLDDLDSDQQLHPEAREASLRAADFDAFTTEPGGDDPGPHRTGPDLASGRGTDTPPPARDPHAETETETGASGAELQTSDVLEVVARPDGPTRPASPRPTPRKRSDRRPSRILSPPRRRPRSWNRTPSRSR